MNSLLNIFLERGCCVSLLFKCGWSFHLGSRSFFFKVLDFLLEVFQRAGAMAQSVMLSVQVFGPEFRSLPSVFVRALIAMMKHHKQKQLREGGVCLILQRVV